MGGACLGYRLRRGRIWRLRRVMWWRRTGFGRWIFCGGRPAGSFRRYLGPWRWIWIAKIEHWDCEWRRRLRLGGWVLLRGRIWGGMGGGGVVIWGGGGGG